MFLFLKIKFGAIFGLFKKKIITDYTNNFSIFFILKQLATISKSQNIVYQ